MERAMKMKPTKGFNKRAFLKQFLLGLQISKSLTSSTSIQQRKDSIKLSANLAMAVVRGQTHWTSALVARLGGQEETRTVLKGIMGKRSYDILMARSYPHPLSLSQQQKVQRGLNSIVRSYRYCCSKSNNAKKRRAVKSISSSSSCGRVSASVVARNLEKKRIKVLRMLVPGGEFLSGSCLLSETLDYVISLKAQVDVLKSLWKATQISSSRNAECAPSASCTGRTATDNKDEFQLFKKS